MSTPWTGTDRQIVNTAMVDLLQTSTDGEYLLPGPAAQRLGLVLSWALQLGGDLHADLLALAECLVLDDSEARS